MEDDDPLVILNTTEDLLHLMNEKKQPLLMYAVKNDMSFKSFRNGHMHIALSEKAEKDLIARLRKFLENETKIAWVIDIDYEPLGETLAFQENQKLDKDKKNISEYPLVKAILQEFNGARIETIIRKTSEDLEENEENDYIITNNMETYEEE